MLSIVKNRQYSFFLTRIFLKDVYVLYIDTQPLNGYAVFQRSRSNRHIDFIQLQQKALFSYPHFTPSTLNTPVTPT